MTAVCGICVSNAVEENCYILMPGCGHVFDRACITNSLGVEYTCPECKNNYLLPSPYRPFQLADSANFIEYKELHKHLMHANCTITQLKDELKKAHEDLSVEQRSRKKSNESLIDLNQQLVALQEKYNNLNSNEIGRLAVAAVSEEEAFITVDQGPSDIQATSNPRNPVPAKETTKICEEKIAYLQLQDTKSKLLVHYNARIQELEANLPNAQGDQKQLMKQHLKMNCESKAIVEKLHMLRYISLKAAANIEDSQSQADRNVVKQKIVISKLSASIKKAKEKYDVSIKKKQDNIKVYVDKIFELEQAFKLSDISDLQLLKTTYQEHNKRLPNDSQMYAYSTVSKELKKVKAKHAMLNRINMAMKRGKLQEKLEHVLTQSKIYPEKIDSHATIIEQAEQMNQQLEAFLNE